MEPQATTDSGIGDTNDRLEPLEPQTTTKDTGAMNDRRSLILEPHDEEKTTTTGGTNDKYWSYRSHERQILETAGATNNKYRSHERQEMILETGTTSDGQILETAGATNDLR